MEKEVEGCANLLLASSALTNFNFSHFSLSGFWKFLLLFFDSPPPRAAAVFFVQNPLPAAPLPKRSRLQPGARLSLNTWHRRSPQIFMRMSRFAVFWRFSPGSESRCRLFFFFFFFLHMLPTGKEQERSQKRVLCPDTDVPIRIHARFSVRNLRPQLTPGLHRL